MNWGDILLWGFIATAVLTAIMVGSQGIGFSRMNLPFLLGSMVTPDRDRAKLIGAGMHFANGWVFAIVYGAIFQSIGEAGPGIGALVGFVQACFVLTVVTPLLPSIHPRMASEQRGPTVTSALEPPGFLGLNYGYRTPLSIIVAHIVYGVILGAFYHVTR